MQAPTVQGLHPVYLLKHKYHRQIWHVCTRRWESAWLVSAGPLSDGNWPWLNWVGDLGAAAQSGYIELR